MAKYQPEYDVSFEKGISAFDAAASEYIDTNRKLSREVYLRQLSAASPKNEYMILRELIRERRGIADDLFKLQASLNRYSGGGGGGSVSQTFRPGDPVKAGSYITKLQNEHTEAQAEMQTGHSQVKSVDVDEVVTHLLEGDRNNAKSKLMQITEDLDANERVGYGIGILQKARDLGAVDSDKQLSSDQLGSLMSIVSSAKLGMKGDSSFRIDYKASLNSDDITYRAFENPRPIKGPDPKNPDEEIVVGFGSPTMNRSEVETFSLLQKPTSTQRVTQKIGRRSAPTDNQGLIDAYTKRLQDIDLEIKNQRDEYKKSKDNYEDLLKGPGFNISLAASAVRPSAFGEILNDFERIRKSDPSFAKEILNASEKRFTVPNLYDDFETLDNADGVSPIESLLESTKNIDQVLGLVEGAAVSEDDVDIIANDASRVGKLFSEGIYKGKTFDAEVTYLGVKMPLNVFMTKIPAQMAATTDRSMKQKLTQEYVNSLREFENQNTESDLQRLNKSSQPTLILADRIDKTVSEVDHAAENKDSRFLIKSLNSLTTDVQSTSPEQGGAGRDEILNILDQVKRTPESDQNFQVTSTRLRMLSDSLRGIGSKATLGAQETYDLGSKEDIVANKPTDSVTIGSEREYVQKGGNTETMKDQRFLITGDIPESVPDGPSASFSDKFGWR